VVVDGITIKLLENRSNPCVYFLANLPYRVRSRAGPVPAPLQDYTHYDAAVLAGTANKNAAAAFRK
jgi:hypothetical protein